MKFFKAPGDTGLSPMESDEERRERLRNRKKKRHDPARNVPNWVRSGLCAFALIECMRSVMIAINITSLLSEEKVDEVFDNWDNCWRTCLSAFYGLAAISQFYAIIRCDRYSIWFTLGFRWFLCLISFEALAADYQPGLDWDLIWIVMLTLLNAYFMDQKSSRVDWVNLMEETREVSHVEI